MPDRLRLVLADDHYLVREGSRSLLEDTGYMARAAFLMDRLMSKVGLHGKSYEDIPRRVPCVKRMHELLGVRADTPFEAGVTRTIEWFKRA